MKYADNGAMSSETLAAVERELRDLSEAYERALMANDADALIGCFWESPKTVRYGVTENLYGAQEIAAFRQNRPSAGIERTVTRVEISALDTDTGYINLEFERDTPTGRRLGRQTQFWRRFPDVGWKVVSAHVSLLPA